jgi:peroxiredoxin Q/BCP
MLQPGDAAPEFSLLDQDGKLVSLEDFRGQKVLVWFFPKASTPGCTAQGCSLRDRSPELATKGVAILGMSKDSVKRQKNFARKHSFPYPLLSDESGETIDAFGAWGPKKFLGRSYEGILRTSFLIDEQGLIEKVFSKVKTRSHGDDVLGSL